MDGQSNYNLLIKTMTNHGLAQRAYALLPHITNVVAKENFMEFTREGTILIDRFQEELKDDADFNLLCHYTCHIWTYSQKEARKAKPERVVL